MKLLQTPFLRWAGALLLLGLPVAAWSQISPNFIGPNNGDWNNAANWDTGAVPDLPNTFAHVNGANTALISATTTGTPQDTFVGRGQIGRLDHRAGTHTDSGWTFVGHDPAGNGTYNLADTTTVGAGISGFAQGTGTLVPGGRLYVGGNTGAGVLNVNTTGGINGNEGWIGDGAGANGKLNLESGTVNLPGATIVGGYGGTGVVKMTGGIFNTGGLYPGGREGNGTVEIAGGVFNHGGWGEVGRGANGVGTVIVSGPGVFNHPTFADDFQLGYSSPHPPDSLGNGGKGTLRVTNGGTFTHNWWINVARSDGADGAVAGDTAGDNAEGIIEVDGAGSKIMHGGGTFNLGEGGSGLRATGTGTITNGGVIEHRLAANGGEGHFVVGRNSGAIGTLTVDGVGSEWRVFRDAPRTDETRTIVSWGGGSKGTVTVKNGGKFNTNMWIDIGEDPNSDGTMVIDGVGSKLDVADGGFSDTNVGRGGKGRMTVKNGAEVHRNTGNWAVVGRDGPADGQLDLETGAQWQDDTGRFVIGAGGGATGRLNVSGASTSISVNELVIGHEGTGSVVQSEGTVTSRNYFSFGASNAGGVGGGNDGIGTYTITGGTLNAGTTGGDFMVGQVAGSKGTLNIDGGAVNVGAWHLDVGTDGGSEGVVNMTGGTLTLLRGNPPDETDLLMGRFGKGTWNQSGGTVNANSWTIIGVDPGSDGKMILNGTATFNHNASTDGAAMIVGRQSTGTLTVADNATLNKQAGDALYLGSEANGNGTITQTGGTISATVTDTRVGWAATAQGLLDLQGGVAHFSLLDVGHDGTGTAKVSGGAVVDAATVNIGTGAGSGALQLSGGSLAATTAVRVGTTGAATLTHTSGQLVTPQLTVGNGVSTTPTASTSRMLDVKLLPPFDPDRITSTLDVTVQGGRLNANAGATIAPSATVNVAGDVNINNGTPLGTATAGHFNIAGGLTLNGDLSVVGNVNVGAGGTLSGSGSAFAASVNILPDGSLSPGNSPGAMLVFGNLSLAAGAHYVCDINGAVAGTSHDSMDVVGTVALTGADLQVTVGPGYYPPIGAIYTIVSNDDVDPTTGTFATAHGAPLMPGNKFTVMNNTGAHRFAIVYTAEAPVLAGGNDVALQVVLSPMNQWQADNFTTEATNPAIAGPLADPDQDGYGNLIEYALVGNPNNGSNPPPGPASSIVADRRVLTFDRDTSRDDVSIHVQASDDLGTWTDLAVSIHGAPFVTSGGATVTESGMGSLQTVTFTDSVTISAVPVRRYLRVIATE